MKRSGPLTILALGTVVTLGAASGIFAVFTDTAKSGTNSEGRR